jgi:hypothetical protein
MESLEENDNLQGFSAAISVEVTEICFKKRPLG